MTVIERIVSYLQTEYHPKAILLHGSRARDDYFDQSDYDLALILEDTSQPRPIFFEGYALDLSGVSPTDLILKSGRTPIWPCSVLFEDEDSLGTLLMERTYEAFHQGPPSLMLEEVENRRNFSKRLIDRLQGRGEDSMLRVYYLGDFYQRFLRYWCEINTRWTCSAHLLIPIIAKEDPSFYQELEGLWTENYCQAAFKLHQCLFKESV